MSQPSSNSILRRIGDTLVGESQQQQDEIRRNKWATQIKHSNTNGTTSVHTTT
ncbi:hypothetical protein QTP88_007462 [Uroleucon formosanum]